MRLLTLTVGLACLAISASAADPAAGISSSVKALAGAYGASYGFAKIRSEALDIGPDGRVTLRMAGGGMNTRGYAHGKIAYFSAAGFLVKFEDVPKPFEMKFVFQKGYPKSFFRDDGAAGVSVFTKV